MSHKNDANTAALQFPHQTKKHFNFFIIQRRGGLVEDQHLAVRVHCPGNCNHLLHRQRAVGKLLTGTSGNAETVQQFTGLFFTLFPVDSMRRITPDIHVLCHGKIGAKRDFLVDCTYTVALGFLRGMDDDRTVMSFNANFPSIHRIYACEHFDQSRFSSTVFTHQRVDLSPPQGKIDIAQRLYARKYFTDPAHRKYDIVLHLINSCCLKLKARYEPRISPQGAIPRRYLFPYRG